MDSIHQAKTSSTSKKKRQERYPEFVQSLQIPFQIYYFLLAPEKFVQSLILFFFFRCQPQNFLKSVLAALNHSLVLTILSVAQTEILSQMSGVNDTNILQCC